jgi:hypothetical protein
MRYPALAPSPHPAPTPNDEDRPDVSKRNRGAHRTASRRPGQRARVDAPRHPTAPTISAPAAEAPVEEMAPAAEVARPAANVMRGSRVRPNSLLASRAAEEYVYVAQDLRRIAVVAVLLFGLLFVTWIAFQALGIPGK